jgi:putative transcriptional regulator
MKRKATKTQLRMRKLRREREWTQETLAKKVGVSAAAICLYESGERTPPTRIAIEIEKALNCPVRQLLEWVEIPA